jgi:hypothetical protein
VPGASGGASFAWYSCPSYSGSSVSVSRPLPVLYILLTSACSRAAMGMMNVWIIATPARAAWTVPWLVGWGTLVLMTNMWTVGLMTVVYWYDFSTLCGVNAQADHHGIRRYHHDVVRLVGRRQATYRGVLIFLIESGALYCITWVRPNCTMNRDRTGDVLTLCPPRLS